MFVLLMGLSTWASAQDIPQAPGAFDGDDPRVIATFFADRPGVNLLEELRVGVGLAMDKDWYVYWRNSGDSGMPTSVAWRMSVDGNEATRLEVPIDWPAPTVHVSPGDILNYGYTGSVVHASTLRIPASAKKFVQIFADIDYLACRKICVLGKTTLSRTFNISKDTQKRTEGVFQARGVPVEASTHGWTLKAVVEPILAESTPQAMLTLTCTQASCKEHVLNVNKDEATKFTFIPGLGQQVSWRTQAVRRDGESIIVELQGKANAQVTPGKELFDGVLKLRDAAGKHVPILVRQELEITEPAPAIKSEQANASPPEDAPDQTPITPKKIEFLYAIILAFFGGLLLNGMPCVFPVLTLKIAAMVEMSHRSREGMIAQAVAYTAGITVSLLTLALVLIGLKFAGTQVGWGFQFQNPWYLVAQSVLMVLFAVNLFGGFEVVLPFNLHVGSMNLKDDGLARSFFEGLLCVLLATPCTAPMMGSAVGFALSANAPTILAIFTALSLGLALPFILLALIPGWQKWMPKPGPWLGHVKTVMGFTCLAVGAWMVWLVGTSYGADSMFTLLLILIALSMISWVYGLVQFGPRLKSRAVLVGGLLLSAALLIGMQNFDVTDANTTTNTTPNDHWEPFDEEAISDYLAQKRPVFLDFTADWCASCKVNEKTILNTDSVRAAAIQHDVVMMKADWTRPDERIRALLAQYNRSGIPMYLVYSPHRPNQPELLPEIITRDRVRKALADAAKKK